MNRKMLAAAFLLLTLFAVTLGAADNQPAAPARGFNWMLLLYVAIIAIVGIVLLVLGYFIWELITPYSVKLQLIEQKNTAVAIVAASFILGMAIIIAAAVMVFA
jgi:putative membrane protein